MAVPPLIMLKGISKSYGKKRVLQDIDFSINKGEIFGIIGVSGCGKTTLLETMVGFLKPDCGDTLFLDKDIYKSVYKEQDKIKTLFGFSSQIPSFYEKLTVEENLYYFGSLYGMKRERIRDNINKILPLVGLMDERDTVAEKLSGGMEKRLDIACAMIHGPQLLILDEPTADLDIILRKQIWDLIKRINSVGTTIIISSHFLNEIESLCFRIALIHNKVVKMVGKVEDIRGKFSMFSEIKLHTRPGRYQGILADLKKRNLHIERHAVKGTDLVLAVRNPEPFLHHLIHIIEVNKEFLVDIQVKKPNLDEIFESLTKMVSETKNLVSEEKMKEDLKKAEAKPDN